MHVTTSCFTSLATHSCILILVPCCVELIVDNNLFLLERTVMLVTHTDGKIPLVPLCEQWGTKDPRVNTLRTVLPGLRVVRQDPTECLISFLCKHDAGTKAPTQGRKHARRDSRGHARTHARKHSRKTARRHARTHADTHARSERVLIAQRSFSAP